MRLPGLYIFLFAGLVVAPALAEEPSTGLTSKPDTYIEADDVNDIVHVFVAGREVMRIDATGLHVNGRIDYSNNLTDTPTPFAEVPPAKSAQ